MAPQPSEITQLLIAWSSGDKAALEDLIPLVYDELRRLAEYYMGRQKPWHTLQPAGLVNEAYLRLVDAKNISWKGRAHFFTVAARAMRQILIDHARRQRYAKRGGGARKVGLDEAAALVGQQPADLIALDDALESLAAIDPRKSRIVELRFFGGLSIDETAEVMGVSAPTIQREWRMAKAWLFHELNEESEYDSRAAAKKEKEN